MISLREIGNRDRWICHLCGLPVAGKDASRDHLKPIAQGGSNDARNLRLAHQQCNIVRGTLPVSEARHAMRVATPKPTRAQEEGSKLRQRRARILAAVQKGIPIR